MSRLTIKPFPNNLGADVSSGSAKFEVWFPERWRPTYLAKRVDAEGYGVAYKEGGFTASSIEEAARLIIVDWRDNRASWKACES